MRKSKAKKVDVAAKGDDSDSESGSETFKTSADGGVDAENVWKNAADLAAGDEDEDDEFD